MTQTLTRFDVPMIGTCTCATARCWGCRYLPYTGAHFGPLQSLCQSCASGGAPVRMPQPTVIRILGALPGRRSFHAH